MRVKPFAVLLAIHVVDVRAGAVNGILIRNRFFFIGEPPQADVRRIMAYAAVPVVGVRNIGIRDVDMNRDEKVSLGLHVDGQRVDDGQLSCCRRVPTGSGTAARRAMVAAVVSRVSSQSLIISECVKTATVAGGVQLQVGAGHGLDTQQFGTP